MLCINGYGHADEQKYPETVPRDAAVKQFATGWVADQVELGRHSEADRQKWIDAASAPDAFGASGLGRVPTVIRVYRRAGPLPIGPERQDLWP